MFFSRFFGRGGKAAIAALTAFLFAAVLLCPSGLNAITLSEEKEMSRKTLEAVRKHMSLVEDGEVLTYVRNVGNRVAKQIGTTPYEFQFFVIDSPVVNAFAVPGGYVFIYRGLIEMMSSEGELASILGHELAHIQARHIQRQIDEAKVLSVASIAGMLAGILLGVGGGSGGGAGPALMAGSAAAGQSAALKYSREHEMEADQLGFRFMSDAGYDPAEMPSIMHKMDQQKWTGSSSVPSYLATHPALGERVLYLDDMAKKKKLSSPKPVQAASGDFQVMQAALIADYTDPAKALERFQAGVKNGDKVAVFGLGRFYLREDRSAEAAVQLQEAARLMPASPYVLSTLGTAYHRSGKLQEAQRAFQSALVLDSSASIVHYRLALVLNELGQKKEAVDHLMQIEELAPMFPEVDYQLGVILGQLNNLGLAHYHLGRYYLHKQNFELALMHYQKAKAYILDSPNKIEEINLILKELEKRKKSSGFRAGR